MLQVRAILPHPLDCTSVAKVHGGIFSGIRPVSIIVQVTRFVDPEWLVETEVDALASRVARGEGPE